MTFIPAVPISSTTVPAVNPTVPAATNTSSGASPTLIIGAAAVLVLAGLAGLIFYLKRRKTLQKNLWEERGLPKALTLAQRETMARQQLGLDPYPPPNSNDQNITGR
ncbi:MAG: LPXTG cell wall anchor domain-containing protein [Acidimicrobiales bacterium]|nr:LPXTG cell wall anchor domain-containing protein [Acidimicrobiales bacterium]